LVNTLKLTTQKLFLRDNGRMKSKFLILVSVLVLPLTLASCGASTEKVDVCKKVMKIVGAYTDMQLKAASDPNGVMADASKIVSELINLADQLPAGSQRDYINTLASDYEAITRPDSGVEAIMGLLADLQPGKISIACPK